MKNIILLFSTTIDSAQTVLEQKELGETLLYNAIFFASLSLLGMILSNAYIKKSINFAGFAAIISSFTALIAFSGNFVFDMYFALKSSDMAILTIGVASIVAVVNTFASTIAVVEKKYRVYIVSAVIYYTLMITSLALL